MTGHAITGTVKKQKTFPYQFFVVTFLCSWLIWLPLVLTNFGFLPSVWVFPLWLLMMVFLGGGQEELGWRGYILDHMEERFGTWLGT
jgi:membrane protease YdiL (CAAX protease family)